MSPTESFAGKPVRVNVRYINDIEGLEGIVIEAGPVGLVMRSGAKGVVRLIPWASVVTVVVLEDSAVAESPLYL